MIGGEARHNRLTFGGNVERTRCGLCPARCGMLVEVEEDRLVRYIGDLDNPVGAGKLCIKATATLELHDHPGRVNHVSKRADRRGEGRWEQIPWDSNANAITPSDPALSSFVGDQPLRGIRCRIRPESPTPS